MRGEGTGSLWAGTRGSTTEIQDMGTEKVLRELGVGWGGGNKQERPECFPYTGKGTDLDRETEGIWNAIKVLEESIPGRSDKIGQEANKER